MCVPPSGRLTRKERRTDASPASARADHPSPTHSVRNAAASSGREASVIGYSSARNGGYFGVGPCSSGFASRITILSMLVGLFGRSCAPVGALTIVSTTSIPFVTCPNALYWLSSDGASATMMKNCDDALFGELERAIERMPRLCLMELNSASMFLPEPPVPQVAGEPEIVFGSPP